MKQRKSSEFEYVYVKKPLNVAVPFLGDMQARKNPFNKTLKMGTVSIKQSTPLLGYLEADQNKLRAKTMLACKRDKHPSLELLQVLKPSSHQTTEMSESIVDDSCNWYTESDTENGAEQTVEDLKSEQENDKSAGRVAVLEGCKSGTNFRAKLTKEVEHNFALIRKLMLATPEDVAIKEIALRNDIRAGKISNKTLILDLDDTLIHSVNPGFNYSAINVTHKDFHTVIYKERGGPNFFSLKVVIRPHALRLLEELSAIYEIVVSHNQYAK